MAAVLIVEGSRKIDKNKVRRAVLAMTVLLFAAYAAYDLQLEYIGKQTESITYDNVKNALEEEPTKNIIFTRQHASQYEFFPLLTKYDNSLIITTSESSWTDFADDELLREEDSITVLLTSADEKEEFSKWAEENFDTTELKVLYEEDSVSVIHWEK